MRRAIRTVSPPDARVLIDGGYRLEKVLPIDQFLWSTHIELIALFRRIANG